MSWHSKEEKEVFISKMKAKTKAFVIDVINFCEALPKTQAYKTISYQLIKSASSTGANYRAACRGRSKAEFFAKLSITVEEADESQYWLEIIQGLKVKCDENELNRLLKESEEILKVIAKARV